MTERPIIFSAPMVRALLDGRKTQTRRLLKPQPTGAVHHFRAIGTNRDNGATVFQANSWGERPAAVFPVPGGMMHTVNVRFAKGDRLWVRESIYHLPHSRDVDSTHGMHGTVGYLADGKGEWHDRARALGAKSRPSIHMPRWAARITLAVSSVRIERLNAISEDDARAEGAAYHDGHGVGHSGWRHDLKDVHRDARSSFARLWNDINGKGAWELNPWIVAVTFSVEKHDGR